MILTLKWSAKSTAVIHPTCTLFFRFFAYRKLRNYTGKFLAVCSVSWTVRHDPFIFMINILCWERYKKWKNPLENTQPLAVSPFESDYCHWFCSTIRHPIKSCIATWIQLFVTTSFVNRAISTFLLYSLFRTTYSLSKFLVSMRGGCQKVPLGFSVYYSIVDQVERVSLSLLALRSRWRRPEAR